MALLLGACGSPAALPPAAAMLGAWSYNSGVVVDGPSTNAGLHVTLAVDSIDGMRFSGRVTEWFAGDVGIAPDVFSPLSGSVDDARAVTLLIRWASPAVPTLTTTGMLNRDLLTIRESWFDTQPGPFPSGGTFRRTR